MGDRIHGVGEVIWTREEPLFGGPLSALEAALSLLSTEFLTLLAVDMPYGPELVGAFAETPMNGVDALIPMDDEGFPQPLSAIYRVDAVRRAIGEMAPVAGKSMREFLSHLNYSEIRLGADFTSMLIDIDTPSDLEKVRNARVD